MQASGHTGEHEPERTSELTNRAASLVKELVKVRSTFRPLLDAIPSNIPFGAKSAQLFANLQRLFWNLGPFKCALLVLLSANLLSGLVIYAVMKSEIRALTEAQRSYSRQIEQVRADLSKEIAESQTGISNMLMDSGIRLSNAIENARARLDLSIQSIPPIQANAIAEPKPNPKPQAANKVPSH
jgi:hypothetical protein